MTEDLFYKHDVFTLNGAKDGVIVKITKEPFDFLGLRELSKKSSCLLKVYFSRSVRILHREKLLTRSICYSDILSILPRFHLLRAFEKIIVIFSHSIVFTVTTSCFHNVKTLSRQVKTSSMSVMRIEILKIISKNANLRKAN
jgi:hypothetical protein